MDTTQALVTFAVAALGGVGGVLLGAVLERRNEARAQAANLLTQALNDTVAAIAEIANGAGPDAMARFASAVSRIGLHAPARVVTAFRRFQDDATTTTEDGRARLLTALRTAREELGHPNVDDDDLAVLLFGPRPISESSTQRRNRR